MEFLLDTADIEQIKKYVEIYPVCGVTSNPSILKAEGKIDLFSHMKEVRNIIGKDKTLHVQVVARDYDGMLRDADMLREKIDEQVYIKVPTTEAGLNAIRTLKKQKANITATAIYYRVQGFMAMACGADYIAPYFNRMENLDEDSAFIVSDFRKIIEREKYSTKILAASFKNMSQVNNAILAGSHAITIQPDTLGAGFNNFMVKKAVDDFYNDWVSVQGKETI
ncbi:MAG: fructose-6-phosphate aldolase [Lactobacillus sp.]|jgi:TalC/MipB family fructose-6-phosphate aldolase|nr:fructose-6-phosphate aldolase [Lactobacillus sp.]